MKPTHIFKLGYLAAVTHLSLVAGCGDPKATISNPDKATLASMEKGRCENVEKIAGIELPALVSLIKSGDGSERDKNMEYRFWVLFCSDNIVMPKMNAPGATNYLNLPLDDTVKFVEEMLRGDKVTDPQKAFGSNWTKGQHEYRGSLVRTLNGCYLVVEQFKKQSGPLKSGEAEKGVTVQK